MDSIKLFKYSRASSLILLPRLDEAIWDIQPDGFPNTIRWNAGHVYAEAEGFLHDADHNYEITHPDWLDLFLDGSRPSEWEGNIPSKDEIIDALIKQEDRIVSFFSDKLTNKASKVRDLNDSGTLLDTVDSSLQFVTWHEGIHLGIMKSLRLLV